jgi:uncharacterized protein (DUF2252 family)
MQLKSNAIPEERRRQGQARRKKLARQGHANWQPAHDRVSPLKLIAASMVGRLTPLVKLKYERMIVSPFGFFRGAVPVMAADLASMPHTGIVNQICGDAHVRNLGAYAAPDGRVVFDINDFDETTRGPFEWDLKRLATSLILAGREAGAKNNACEESVLCCISSYRHLIHLLADLPVIELAHYQVHRMQKVAPVSEALQKAQMQTPQSTLVELTETGEGKSNSVKNGDARHFKHEPPVLRRITGAKAQQVLDALPGYAKDLLPERQHFLAMYRPCDVGFKVVGTGSVGLRDYLVYFEGNGLEDPLFLQIKEEVASAYEPYFPDKLAAKHQGQRVAEGQRAMQYQSDPFLGWTKIAGRDYLVRQLNDHKANINVAELNGSALNEYAQLCGELLARGHARSGDAQMLSGYLGKSGKFDEALSCFAREYADQTEKDWRLLVRSRKGSVRSTKQAARK